MTLGFSLAESNGQRLRRMRESSGSFMQLSKLIRSVFLVELAGSSLPINSKA